MGYTTYFTGSFSLTPSLSDEQKEYLTDFSETRRVKRDPIKIMEIFKGEGGYPGRSIENGNTIEEIYGKEGGFFNTGLGVFGQSRDASIIDSNYPPIGQPGLWCQWIPNEDGTELMWDDGEKFYHYTQWLEYLIITFFEPWGIKVNGEVKWRGEDSDDLGLIVVDDNRVTTKEGHIEYN